MKRWVRPRAGGCIIRSPLWLRPCKHAAGYWFCGGAMRRDHSRAHGGNPRRQRACGVPFQPRAAPAGSGVGKTLEQRGIVFHRTTPPACSRPARSAPGPAASTVSTAPSLRACFEAGVPQDFFTAPAHIPGVTGVKSDRLEDWEPPAPPPRLGRRPARKMDPRRGRRAGKAASISGGAGAKLCGDARLSGLDGTSKLSPHVRLARSLRAGSGTRRPPPPVRARV